MSALKRFLRFLVISVGIIAFITVAAWLLGLNTEAVRAASVTIVMLRYYFFALRVLAIFGVWYYWNELCDRIFDKGVVDYQTKRETLRALRGKFSLGFIGIELLVAQNLLGVLLGGIL